MRRFPALLAIVFAVSGCEFLLGNSSGSDAGLAADSGAGQQEDAGGIETPPDASTPWTVQIGTSDLEAFSAVAVNASGEIAVAGYANLTPLPGQVNHGHADAVIARYTAEGTQIFLDEFGSDQPDGLYGVVEDDDGSTYACGSAMGALFGPVQAAQGDGFVVCYRANGNQRGGVRLAGADPRVAQAIARVPGGDLFVVGRTVGGTGSGTLQAFLSRVTNGCALVSSVEFGGFAHPDLRGIAVDGEGKLVAAGQLEGALDGSAYAGGLDAVVMRMELDGTRRWVKTIGTAQDDGATQVAVYGQNVYVVGTSAGVLADGGASAAGGTFLASFELATGTQRWIRQWATSDSAFPAVAIDKNGLVYVSSNFTYANHLQGEVRAFGSDGTEAHRWTYWSADSVFSQALAVDRALNLIVTGDVWGSLDGQPAGMADDMFLKKIVP